MKKILAMVLSLAIVASLAITGTVAYLQDTDDAVNVMTMGNVFIEQYEQERVSESDSTLRTFKQGQQLVPLVGNSESKGEMIINGYDIPNVRNLSDAKNYVDKIVSVKNTGTADAYVRTIFAFPEATPSNNGKQFYTAYNASEQWFHWNGSSDTDTTKDNGWMWGKDKSEWPGNTDNWDVVEDETITVDGEARTYDIYVATNKNVIKPGEITSPSLLGFFVDTRVDNEKTEDGKIYYTFTTSDGTVYDLGDITDLNVLVFSQAVQADGFPDAWTALDTAFGDIKTGSHPWSNNNTTSSVTRVETAAELKDALAEGGDIVIGDNITVTETLKVTAGKAAKIILNGNLNYAVSNDGKASAIINNAGNLTLAGNGMISFVAADPDLGAIPAYATNTITNTGTLTIGDGITITNGSEGGASYAVDNHGKFYMNGGTLIGDRCALRVAKYNQDDVVFEMNGGTIEAKKPAWIQLPGSNSSVAPKITVTINGGTMKSTKDSSADNDVLYTYSYGNSHANTKVIIKGGEFLGGVVSVGAGYKGDVPAVGITGGTFEYDVVQWLANDAFKVLRGGSKRIDS